MSKINLLLLLAMLLTAACAEAPVSGDMAVLDARATLAVITQQAQETQSARIEATRQAGIASARLDAEAALISTQAAIRQQDLVGELTQQALDDDRATASAAPLLATQSARQTQPAMDATATMIAVASNIAVEGEHRARAMTWAYPIGWIILCIGLSVSLWNVASWAIARQDRRSRVIETRSGTLVLIWDTDSQEWTWTAVQETRSIRSLESQVETAPAVTLSPGSVTARSPMPDIVRKQVTQLLKRAQEIGGDTSYILPGHREMGWTSSKWQFVISILRASGVGVTQPNRGTYVAERWGNVDNVLYALETGQIELHSPTPERTSSSE